MIVSLAVHINCFACASRFLSAILVRSRPYLRRQLSCHTIDTMLFACPLWLHAPSLCIEGHLSSSYCISTDLSALLTPWHRKIIPCARDRYEIVGGEGYFNTLSLEGTVPKVRQITAMNYTRNHHANLIQKNCAENWVLLSFQSFPCTRQRCVNDVLFFQGCFDKLQGLLGKIQGLFKDLTNFSVFKDFSRGWCFFKDYSRPVRTMQGEAEKIESLVNVNMLSWSSPLCHWYTYCLGKTAASVINVEFWSVSGFCVVICLNDSCFENSIRGLMKEKKSCEGFLLVWIKNNIMILFESGVPGKCSTHYWETSLLAIVFLSIIVLLCCSTFCHNLLMKVVNF